MKLKIFSCLLLLLFIGCQPIQFTYSEGLEPDLPPEGKPGSCYAKCIIENDSAQTTDWFEVLCPKYHTGKLANTIKERLQYLGYETGEIDKINQQDFKTAFDDKSRKALVQFQKDNNLPQGRLSIETLKKLKINVRY